MSIDAGTLNLKLMADISDLVSKMGEAKDKVNGSMDTMSNAFGLAKTAFVGLIGVGSVGAFAGMIKGSIDTTGALKDMSIQTGASEAALREFRNAGVYTETGLDSITGAMGKLSKNMVNGTEDSKGAGIAIKALGLDFDTIKAMKPEDQMLAIAGSMNQFADGADKSAAAQALFGKAGAELLPFLKDLGDSAQDITTKLTDQEVALLKTQAAMADAFGDNLSALQKNAVYLKDEIVIGITPALWELSQAFVDVSKSGNGVSNSLSTMAKEGTLNAWARDSVLALTYLMDGLSGVGAVIRSTAILTNAFWMALGSTGDGEKFKQITEGVGEALDKTWGTKTLGADLRDRMDDIRKVGIVSEAAKPQLDTTAELKANEAARLAEKEATKAQEAATKSLNAELKKQEDQYNKLTSSIDEKILSIEQSMEKGAKLSEAEKIENKLLADMASSTIILTDAQLASTLAKINQLKAAEDHAEALKKENKEINEGTKLTADLIEKLQKEADSTEAAAERMREHNDTMFLSREELIQLSAHKDRDTAATLLRNAAVIEAGGAETAITAEWRRQATALTTLAGLKEQGIHVQAAKDAYIEWDKTSKSIGTGLSSALTDATLNGKDIWRTFRDFMVKTIIDGVLKNALAGVITDALNGLNSSVGGMISSIFSKAIGGSAGGSVAGSAAGSAAGSGLTGMLSSAGTSISNFLGIGGTTSGAFATGGIAAGMGSAAAGTAGILETGAAVTAATDAALLAEISGAGVTAVGGSAAGGAAAGGLGGLGTAGSLAAMVAAAYVAQQAMHAIMGFGGTNSVLDTRAVHGSGTYYDPERGENGATYNLADLLIQKQQTTGGEIFYEAYWGGSGTSVEGATAIGRTSTTQEMSAFINGPVPAFAGGGMFPGGARLVGERGPEIEVTGPSRIFDAATTASMLRSGGANGQELIDEMRLLRAEMRATAGHTAKTASLLDRAMPDGDALQTRATA